MSPYVDIELSTQYVSQSYSVHHVHLNVPDYTNSSTFHTNIASKVKSMLMGHEACVSNKKNNLKFIIEQINQEIIYNLICVAEFVLQNHRKTCGNRCGSPQLDFPKFLTVTSFTTVKSVNF